MHSKVIGLVLAALFLSSACSISQDNIIAENTPKPAENPEPDPTTAPQAGDPTPFPERSGGDADVIFVRAVLSQNGSWTFHVTVAHPDTGWEDYADGWDVVLPDGTVLKSDPEDRFTRTLLHPHENEQPFTRSQSGLEIPDQVRQVTVRAHDLVDGFGGRTVTVSLDLSSGEGFEVEK